ncbi:MAG: hypothetical protein U5L05_10675 [Rubrivivax sp.]|nr:hypothetical protein [Rubrivivax sp.]
MKLETHHGLIGRLAAQLEPASRVIAKPGARRHERWPRREGLPIVAGDSQNPETLP